MYTFQIRLHSPVTGYPCVIGLSYRHVQFIKWTDRIHEMGKYCAEEALISPEVQMQVTNPQTEAVNR